MEDIPEVSEIWGVKLGKKFMMDIRNMKPYETIGRYKGPVLIVHGTDDKVVPLDYSKRAQETYSNASTMPKKTPIFPASHVSSFSLQFEILTVSVFTNQSFD